MISSKDIASLRKRLLEHIKYGHLLRDRALEIRLDAVAECTEWKTEELRWMGELCDIVFAIDPLAVDIVIHIGPPTKRVSSALPDGHPLKVDQGESLDYHNTRLYVAIPKLIRHLGPQPSSVDPTTTGHPQTRHYKRLAVEMLEDIAVNSDRKLTFSHGEQAKIAREISKELGCKENTAAKHIRGRYHELEAETVNLGRIPE